MANGTQNLLSERDRIGNEINRLTVLLSSIEDPGPFHQIDSATGFPLWRNITTGELRGIVYNATSIQSGALVGWSPVYIDNPDYIADDDLRAQRAAEINAEIAALRAQLNVVIAQVFGGAAPASTVVTVTSQQTATGPVQVLTTAPSQSTTTGAPLSLKSSPMGPIPPQPSLPANNATSSISPGGGYPTLRGNLLGDANRVTLVEGDAVDTTDVVTASPVMLGVPIWLQRIATALRLPVSVVVAGGIGLGALLLFGGKRGR
jgi:hypothetical protein